MFKKPIPWSTLLAPSPPDENSSGGTGKNPPAKTEPNTGADELAAAKAAAAAANAELKKVQDQVAADKKKAEEDKLKADGKTAELLTAKEKELAEAAGDIALGKAFRERETKRIDEAKGKLTESQQKLLDRMPDLSAKSALLDELLGAAGKGTDDKKTAPKGGSPKNTDGIDFAAAFNDAATWAEVKLKDPDGANAFIDARIGAKPNGAYRPLQFLPSAAPAPKK